MILKFWIHLEHLPENSIARQCLKLSVQLADVKRQSFMNSVIEILQLYGFVDGTELQDLNSSTARNVHMNLPRIKQKIMNSLRTHQMQSIQSNKKLQFYSSFKMTQDASVQIDLVKNLQHR